MKEEMIMYENINNTTKKAQGIIRMFKSRFLREWRDLYKNPSRTKEEIKDYWDKELSEVNAHIVGYVGNCSSFSIYAESEDAYYYITKAHNYRIAK